MFNLPFFENFSSIVSGLLSGIAFGFLLRKGNVTNFNTIVKQLLLKDFTVMKIIFTAILVGSIGIFFMSDLNLIKLALSNRSLIAVAIGGIIFGAGMAIMGYCPGTAVAALADGAKDVKYGIIGMFFGAFVFGETFNWINSQFKLTNDLNAKTLSSVLSISPWLFIFILALFLTIFFYLLEKKYIFKNNK